MRGVYRIANRAIEIISVYPEVHAQCGAYRCGDMPEFTVQTKRGDIDFEREKSAREAALEGRAPYDCPPPMLESLAVYRKIAEAMPALDTFLFHSSAVAVDGRAYLFAAKSGTGKSTHTRLWRALLGDRARMVNDDKPLIRVDEGRAVVFGTPWNGKERLGENIAAPVEAICLLRRGARNRIRTLSPDEAYARLMQQIYRPMNAGAMQKTLDLLDGLCAAVRLYELECNMDIEAARVAWNAMGPKGACEEGSTGK